MFSQDEMIVNLVAGQHVEKKVCVLHVDELQSGVSFMCTE